jgi:hypothetical protein
MTNQNINKGVLEDGKQRRRTACGDSGHAETKHKTRHDEFVSFPFVRLEDCHVADCGANEQHHEDGSDWNIEANGRKASQ